MITDQNFGVSDDLFLDQYSAILDPSVAPSCRRGGEKRFLFLDQYSLTIEDATAPKGLYEGDSSFQNYSNSQL